LEEGTTVSVTAAAAAVVFVELTCLSCGKL
jgi:hypothetical protein